MNFNFEQRNVAMPCENTNEEVTFELSQIGFHPDPKVTTFFYV